MVSGTQTESVDMPLRAHHKEMIRCRFRNAHSVMIARENGRAQRCDVLPFSGPFRADSLNTTTSTFASYEK